MYHQQLKQVRIYLSNNEIVFGDIIDQNKLEFVVELRGGAHMRIMRAAIIYIEENVEAPAQPELQRRAR